MCLLNTWKFLMRSKSSEIPSIIFFDFEFIPCCVIVLDSNLGLVSVTNNMLNVRQLHDVQSHDAVLITCMCFDQLMDGWILRQDNDCGSFYAEIIYKVKR